MNRIGVYWLRVAIVGMLVSFSACDKEQQQVVGEPFVPREPQRIEFSEIEVTYHGDDIGEALSDGWLIRLRTDMEIDDAGNPIGEGAVMQLLLNAPYDAEQSADVEYVTGSYTVQTNSGDFSPMSFVPGYMTTIDLPGGRVEVADGSFFATLDEGSTVMNYDLLDEGSLHITINDEGVVTIDGVVAGSKFLKRYFSWSGNFDITSEVEEGVPNSTIDQDVELNDFTQAQLQDRGDIFYLKDESYRSFLLFMADDGIDLATGRPQGSGRVLRLELLVPWSTDKADGIPAGVYTMLQRNEDTSIDRDQLVPYRLVPGLPDLFSYPYISGSWYIDMEGGEWRDYARLVGGELRVERGDDGSHVLQFELTECSNSGYKVAGSMSIAESIAVY